MDEELFTQLYESVKQMDEIVNKGVKSPFDVYVYSRGARSLVPSTTTPDATKQ